LESLSPAGSVRFAVFDAHDSAFTSEELLCTFNAMGATQPSGDEIWTRRLYQVPDWRLGSAGDVVRVKAFITGGPGTSVQFSAWLDGI
jgi:hypothetical protein